VKKGLGRFKIVNVNKNIKKAHLFLLFFFLGGWGVGGFRRREEKWTRDPFSSPLDLPVSSVNIAFYVI
jgi:hypothetical protein